jgi:hypothetical protein
MKLDIAEKIIVPMNPRWARLYDICADRMMDFEASRIQVALLECPEPPKCLNAIKLAENLYLAASLEINEAGQER